MNLMALFFTLVAITIVIWIFSVFNHHPNLGIFFVFLSIPFGGVVISSFGKTPNLFFGAALSAIVVMVFYLKKFIQGEFFNDIVINDFSRKKKSLHFLVLIYLAFCVLSLLQAWDLFRSAYIVVTRILVLSTFLAALHYAQNYTSRIWLLRATNAVGITTAIMYLWNGIVVYGASSLATLAEEMAKKRNIAKAGMLGYSNTIASILVLTLMLTSALIFIPGKHKKDRFLAIVGAFIQATALFATSSRGGVISLAGGLIVAILLNSRIIRQPKWIVRIIATFAVGYLFFISIPKPLYERYALYFSEPVLTMHSIQRLELFQSSWRAFLENPILGIGIGNVGFYDLYFGTGAGSETHNLFLQTLGEEGIFSFILLSLILFVLGQRLLRLNRKSSNFAQTSVSAAFFATIINAGIEPSFWATQFAYFFWISIAILTSSCLTDTSDKIIQPNILKKRVPNE